MAIAALSEPPVKRGRGRPRIHPIKPVVLMPDGKKRGRGRPRKSSAFIPPEYKAFSIVCSDEMGPLVLVEVHTGWIYPNDDDTLLRHLSMRLRTHGLSVGILVLHNLVFVLFQDAPVMGVELLSGETVHLTHTGSHLLGSTYALWRKAKIGRVDEGPSLCDQTLLWLKRAVVLGENAMLVQTRETILLCMALERVAAEGVALAPSLLPLA
jgi:hypothetical protein